VATRLLRVLVALVLTVAGLVGISLAAGSPASAGGDRDCGDFSSQASAQQFYLGQGGPGSDPHGLDSDDDGVACESNPCPCSSSQGGGQDPGPGQEPGPGPGHNPGPGLGHNPPPPKPQYKVQFNLRDSTPTVGRPVRMAGKVRPLAPGKVVLLQIKADGSGWVDAKRFRLSRESSFRADVVFTRAGRASLRLVKSETRAIKQGISEVIPVVAKLAPPQIVACVLPEARQDVPYSALLRTIDGRPGTFSVMSGSLPPGLQLAPSGLISGTPTGLNQYSFEVRFTDSAGLSDRETCHINVAPGTPVITTTGLANGAVGLQYSQTLTTQRVGPYIWEVVAGALPPGLLLNAGVPSIEGTPTTIGTYTFTLRAALPSSPERFDTQELTIVIGPAVP
jgi:hypothetical protein